MSDWAGTNTGEVSEVLSKLSDDFEEFMTVQVQIAAVLSKDKFGQNVYDSYLTTYGIFIEKLETIIDKDNQKVDSNSRIFIDGSVIVGYNSKILVEGMTPTIKKISKLRDENGIYCKIIYI